MRVELKKKKKLHFIVKTICEKSRYSHTTHYRFCSLVRYLLDINIFFFHARVDQTYLARD